MMILFGMFGLGNVIMGFLLGEDIIEWIREFDLNVYFIYCF